MSNDERGLPADAAASVSDSSAATDCRGLVTPLDRWTAMPAEAARSSGLSGVPNDYRGIGGIGAARSIPLNDDGSRRSGPLSALSRAVTQGPSSLGLVGRGCAARCGLVTCLDRPAAVRFPGFLSVTRRSFHYGLLLAAMAIHGARGSPRRGAAWLRAVARPGASRLGLGSPE